MSVDSEHRLKTSKLETLNVRNRTPIPVHAILLELIQHQNYNVLSAMYEKFHLSQQFHKHFFHF